MLNYVSKSFKFAHTSRRFFVTSVDHAAPSSLVTQYRYVPVGDHPIFPGSTATVSLTQSEYDLLKETETVFASIVKNDAILKNNSNDLMGQLQKQVLRMPDVGLPRIKSEADIYTVGTICQSKAIQDAQNPFSPYMLNLFPLRKAHLSSFVDPIGPLARVIVDEIRHNDELEEKDLNSDELVIFKFIKQQYLKCFKIAPDEKFLAYLQYLERSFDTRKVNEFVNMLLTCVSLPQYINTYQFLVKARKHELQKVFESNEVFDKLQGASDIFTDFVNKIEIWQKLEQ